MGACIRLEEEKWAEVVQEVATAEGVDCYVGQN